LIDPKKRNSKNSERGFFSLRTENIGEKILLIHDSWRNNLIFDDKSMMK